MNTWKIFISTSIGYAFMCMFIFGALFASNPGMGLPVGDATWIQYVAGMISNIVNFWVGITLIFTIVLLAFILSVDGYIENTVNKLVKVQGIVKTGNGIEFKKWKLVCISLPYWTILIVAGWTWTALTFITAFCVMQLLAFLQRDYFNDTFINTSEVDNVTTNETVSGDSISNGGN